MYRFSFRDALRQYRWKELGLFIIPFIILLLEMTQLLLARLVHSGGLNATASLSTKNLPTIEGLIPVLGLIAVLFAINILLSIFFPKADQILLPLVGLLSGIGVLMALRIGPNLPPPTTDPSLGTRQLVWVMLGFVAFLITIFGLRSMDWLRRNYWLWAILGIAMVGITLTRSLRANLNSPTHDQLNIGPLNLQPSELLKIFLVIFFAAYLSRNIESVAEGGIRVGPFRLPPLNKLGPILLMLGLALLLFLGIRELGLALLIYGIFLVMIYLGTGNVWYVIGSLVVFVALALVGYKLFGYVRLRFAAVPFDVVNWQNWTQAQEQFATGDGLQLVQGIIALSSGGIIGAGLGLGHPTFVPVVQSDMIFTALGEELGLAALFAILGIYLFIIYRGFRIAIEATDTFNQLLAAGLTSIFAIQTLIIAAGNMKLLPLTGIPLPFLSYGGSSIIANYIIIGILLRISHNTARERQGLA
ncbi:MAG TPA: FtsW/RodA/SpoVE family cell cycle protein [Ktedonobacteraceae bacterium]|nr:FtsW/RodA/SpoVE family cell cycle protein [Ktedonobacteraceae bacterium]